MNYNAVQTAEHVPDHLMESGTGESRLGVPDVSAFLRRYSLLLLICTFAGIAIGMIHVLTTAPVYVATSEVLINPKQPRTLNETAEAGLMQVTIDSSQIESQIEVLKSDRIAQAVFKSLNLGNDPEFQLKEPAADGAVHRALSSVGLPWAGMFGAEDRGPRSKEEAEKQKAIDQSALEGAQLSHLQESLNVRRVGQSYVLSISFSSHSPIRASQIVNAVAAAYISDKLDVQLQAALNGQELLQKSIDDLRGQVAMAQEAMRSGQIDVANFPSADARVITAGSIPLGKSYPKTSLVLVLAGGFSLLIGLVIAALREALDVSTRAKRQVEHEAGMRLLGRVRKVRKGPGQSHVLTRILAQPNSPFADDIRNIQTTLDLAQRDSDVRCIGITSCFPQEGKSTLASNLGNWYAMMGVQTVVLDCDTRSRTRVSALLQPDGTEPLTAFPNLNTLENGACDVREAGNGNGSNLSLDRHSVNKLGRLLGTLRDSYELVLVDLPALSLAPDARALSPYLDGLIIVASYGRTPVTALAEASYLLSHSRGRLLGCVMNNAPRPHHRTLD
jgi:Mrp family chromosome partitioning ATPase